MYSFDQNKSLAGKLLGYLSRELGLSDLDYMLPPSEVQSCDGGTTYRFRLFGGPKELAHFLILKLYDDTDLPVRIPFETTVQNILFGVGLPVAKIHFSEPDTSVLGKPFTVMDELKGEPVFDPGLLVNRNKYKSVRQLARGRSLLPHLLASALGTLHSVPLDDFTRELRDIRFPLEHISVNGRLYQMYRRVQTARSVMLEPAIMWFISHLPGSGSAPVICHGDLHPQYLLSHRGLINGILNWSINSVVLGDRMYDVGRTYAILKWMIPGILRYVSGFERGVNLHQANLFLKYYGNYSPIDRHEIRYYELLWCIDTVITVIEQSGADSCIFRKQLPGNRIEHMRLAKHSIGYFNRETGLNIHPIQVSV